MIKVMVQFNKHEDKADQTYEFTRVPCVDETVVIEDKPRQVLSVSHLADTDTAIIEVSKLRQPGNFNVSYGE